MRKYNQILLCGCAFWAALLFFPAPAAMTAEEAPNYDTPMARYGDLELSLGYFFYYTRVSGDKLRMLNRASSEERKEMIDNALLETIFEHKAAEDAVKNGFTEDPEYKAHSRNIYNDWLTRFYEYHNFYQPYKPDEELLKKMYEEKKEEFFLEEQFSFRHIFFRTIDRSEEEQRQARENADKAMALIRGGSDFVEVAKLYSDSERTGSVIGPMKPGKYNPEKPLNPVIENALLSLKVGEVSDIVPTKYGYEILKLESHRPESYQPFESVKNRFLTEQRKTDYDAWKSGILEKYWDEAVTKFHPDVIFDENADPNAVVFEVYGQTFTKTDYDLLKGREAQKKPEETEEAYRERLLDFLKNTHIYRFIAAQLARDLNYDQIPFYKERTKAMINSRSSMAWINRLLEKYIDEHPNTEAEKKAFYEENQSRFLEKQTAHIAEMTFNLPPHNSEVLYEVHKAQQAAESKAQKALERLKNGEDFAAVAREMSESETAKDGGDLGIISAETEKLPRIVSSQAVRLATGEFCKEPVKSGDSYYIVKCYDKPKRQPIPFDEPQVQAAIDRGLTSRKQSEFRQKLMDQFVDQEKIEILYDGLYDYDPVNLTPPSLNPPSKEQEEKKADSPKQE
ncbi:MAG: peptidylprolyl isomerase [Candidatus Hinthialibacter sp.]